MFIGLERACSPGFLTIAALGAAAFATTPRGQEGLALSQEKAPRGGPVDGNLDEATLLLAQM
jgi:hypothetical protein